MKSVLFTLRDVQGESIKDNIALARALYCAGMHTWRYENA